MCRNSLKNTGIEHNEIKRLNSHQRSEQKWNDLQLPPTPTFNTVFVSSMVNAFNVMCRLCHNLIYHLNLNICSKIDFVQMTNFVIHFVVSSSSFCVFFSFWNFVFEFSVSERNVKKWRKKERGKEKRRGSFHSIKWNRSSERATRSKTAATTTTAPTKIVTTTKAAAAATTEQKFHKTELVSKRSTNISTYSYENLNDT